MNKFEIQMLSELRDKGLQIQEAKVLDSEDSPYWYSSVLERDGFPLGGGFGQSRLTARKIAMAEYVERSVVLDLQKQNPKKWGFDQIKTACGFAVGFNEFNTKYRSICEAIERWVMSKWIDEQYFISEKSYTQVEGGLSRASKFFYNYFDEVKFYEKEIQVNIAGDTLVIKVAQTMGIKGDGIYPGSSAQLSGDGCIWEHALLESFRHLKGIENNPLNTNMFPDNKILFFSKNSDVALKQINKAQKKNWQIPKISFHKMIYLDEYSAFLSRTIVNGWKCWSEGPIERFLY